jgi:hypothetical protein
MLAIAASVAYAITVAAAGEPSARDAQTTIVAAQTPADNLMNTVVGGPITSTAAVVGADRGEVCDTAGGRMLYVGFHSWIPAETGAPRCPDGLP